MSVSELNCDAIVQRLQFYLQESHDAQNAVDMLLDDCDSDALNEEQIDFVREEILIPAIVFRFAEHYDRISRLYKSDPDPSGVFRTFCKFEHLDEHLAKAIAQAINEAAASDDWDDWENDDEDNVVFDGEKDWKSLSADERQTRVKNFLRKQSSKQAANGRSPFLRKETDIGYRACYVCSVPFR